mgnify:CR=1
MAKELVFTERFKQNYQDLPWAIQKRFDKQLKLFLENPKHPSLRIHRYKSEPDVWEAYVTMKYRFTFSITEEVIVFRNIGPHAIIDRGQV